LLGFQAEGARFLASRRHALLADAPGLGKTLQVIAAAEMIAARSILVVCPASVRLNWYKEICECLGYEAARRWEICGYEQAVIQRVRLSLRSWDVFVPDEAHFLKTVESKRTQAIFANGTGIARKALYKWPLTGTPVLNRPRELYPILKTLHPAFAQTSFPVFAQRYCGAYFDGRGIDTKGNSHLDELSRLLEGFMLRRTKRQAFPDRTDPLVEKVPLELSAEDLQAVHAEEEEITNRPVKLSPRSEEYSQLGDTSRLLRLLGLAKINAVVAFVEDLLGTVDKVVVFAHHREVIHAIQNRFSGAVSLTGGMSDISKALAVDSFRRFPECRVFIGQRQAAGIGINGLQTVSSTVVIAEPSWVPGETEQMIDRLDRMGQEDEIVNAYILCAQGTLEEAVVAVHDRKARVVEKLIG